jgi:transposase
VYKKCVLVCRLYTSAAGAPAQGTRRFSTMTAEPESLAAWLAEEDGAHVVMESTGVSWQPIYNASESRFALSVASPKHLRKHVQGRKTDVQAAVWLAELLQYGLIRVSFIPDSSYVHYDLCGTRGAATG